MRLSGIAKVIVATTDAALAADAYGRGFGLEVGAASVDEDRGVLSVVCRPPKGGIIEPVSAIDTSREFAQDIACMVKEKGEGIYALVLCAEDPRSAASVLRSRGLDLSETTGIETSVFGTRILIE